MIILAIRTDKPLAEIGLYHDGRQLGYDKWQAHRELSETLHKRIALLLDLLHKNLNDIEAIIAYAGPGSFTGLRIGISLANALAYARNIPIVGSTTDDWIELGCQLAAAARKQPYNPVVPIYGAPVHITPQRK